MVLLEIYQTFGLGYTMFNFYDNWVMKKLLLNGHTLSNDYRLEEGQILPNNHKFEILESNKGNFFRFVKSETVYKAPIYVGGGSSFGFGIPIGDSTEKKEEEIYQCHTIRDFKEEFKGNIVNYEKCQYINTQNDLQLILNETYTNPRALKISLPLRLDYTASDKFYRITNGKNYYIGTNKNYMINQFAILKRKPYAFTVAATTGALILYSFIKN